MKAVSRPPNPKFRIPYSLGGFTPLETRKLLTGFTLLELIIILGLIAILTSVTVLVLNPAERLRQARDASRIVDLRSVNDAIKYFDLYGGSSFGSPNVLYVSLPDPALSGNATSTCPNMNLPSLSGGWSYQCVSNENLRKVNGLGWLPVNLAGLPPGSPLPALPVDPVNASANGNYYTYVTGSWELTAVMESEKYGGPGSVAATDGGTASSLFEIGSDFSLTPGQSEGRETFTFNAGAVTHTSDADFGGGSHSGTAVSDSRSGGSVKLATLTTEEFSGSSLPSGWSFYSDDASEVTYSVTDRSGFFKMIKNTGQQAYPFAMVYKSHDGSDITIVSKIDRLNSNMTGGGANGQWIYFGPTFRDASGNYFLFSVSVGAGQYHLRVRPPGEGFTDLGISFSPISSYPDIWLRIQKSGTTYTSQYSFNGTSWTTAHTASYANAFNSIGIGYKADANGGSTGAAYADNFSPVSGYSSSGSYTSAVINTGQPSAFTTLDYAVATPSGTSLSVDVRAGDAPTPDGSWTSWQTNISSGGSLSALGTKRYVQYRANLSTSNPANTPSLDAITINFTY